MRRRNSSVSPLCLLIKFSILMNWYSSGLVSKSKGGCATLDLVGNFTNFQSTTGHGLTSIGLFSFLFMVSSD